MILKKTFVCNTKNADEVFIAIAEEIKNGYTLHKIISEPLEMSFEVDRFPEFEVTLKRKDKS